MAQCMHFMKTDCNGKISHVSEFQNHLQTKSNLHILFVSTDSKNQACHSAACHDTRYFSVLPKNEIQKISKVALRLRKYFGHIVISG